MQTRVVKLGGSLWQHPGMEVPLRRWLARQPVMRNVIVVGGGDYAEQVRELDRCSGLDNVDAHWLAIRAMSLLAWTLCQFDSAWQYIDTWQQLERTLHTDNRQATVIFDPDEFLRRHEPQLPGMKLPSGWHVTSDSIAARICQVVDGAELTLLKSRLPFDAAQTPKRAVDYVDAHFVSASRGVRRIRCVDLIGGREAEFGVDSRANYHHQRSV